MKHLKSNARAKVMLNIALTDGWESDCTCNQILTQAKSEALRIIKTALNTIPERVTIIGDPIITITLIEND